MIVRLWGTRGSLASSGPETAGYGGNTASVEIVNAAGTILALDAGTGIVGSEPPSMRLSNGWTSS